MKQKFRNILEGVKRVLGKLSFRTGVMVLVACAIFYILSFAQALLPIPATAKSVLFIILFGMAIVGVKGWRRIKMGFKRWMKKRQFKKSLRERDNTNK